MLKLDLYGVFESDESTIVHDFAFWLQDLDVHSLKCQRVASRFFDVVLEMIFVFVGCVVVSVPLFGSGCAMRCRNDLNKSVLSGSPCLIPRLRWNVCFLNALFSQGLP